MSPRRACGWTEPMADAYAAGVEDARAERAYAPARGGGFTACYAQGYAHGQTAVVCPHCYEED